MDSRLHSDIAEILTRENERFQLVKLGFIKRIEDDISFYAERFPRKEGESFSEWKHRTLKEYYREKGFGRFCRENINNPLFEHLVHSIMKRAADKAFRSSERSQTDYYLAPDGDTVSYLIPQSLFDELYATSFSNIVAFSNSRELNDFCNEIVKENMPTDENRIIRGMKNNDQSYWGKFFTKLKPITSAFCYQMSGVYGENNVHDIWSDTCVIVNRALVDGKMTEPVDAKAIISYSVGILKNKNREISRKRVTAPEDIDAIQYRLTAEDEEKFFNNPVTVPENFMSHSDNLSNYIDLTDKDSVNGYFIVILYNKEHPLHNILTKGLEDKVEKMFEHYIDGLSYEEIVEKHMGKKSGKELVKQCAQLRQEIKRLKGKLLERYDKILQDSR